MAEPITYSATDMAFAPIEGQTSIPRALQASTSMVSSPTPIRATSFRFGAASKSAVLTMVSLRTIIALASATSLCNSSILLQSFGSQKAPYSAINLLAVGSCMNSEITTSAIVPSCLYSCARNQSLKSNSSLE